ncbi:MULTISPECIES: SDR family NAD(P)-dependent oxidoreductase [Burkholderia cepacia complex]|uniref:SDR family NAD(P)-dependent oxidoreductase n=1 Tax=Burkholderia cepacia complex TaxID=87882 RepID=UPI00075500B5|nr:MULTISPECIES: SDR family NAD(P)-dependent oxidoreductase [Burkholderia cepacia complex]KVE90473.1 short-chain dehydrogenase [Burkholderia cepacia]KVF30723.1 short-chain dehydrogenase [Burkholderia vietnamiensis]KVF40979.1 short-chain dehydrogenase [Burkholderia vietnamiensis]MCA8098488.1 SDR family NAD(P)-dependent oxidoreductase [Burkholderia contaminans]MCA8288424.1 SDR family NAD(P)-dependent oxidoreductase [Burkholderia vietnamiensis]
MTSKKTIALFGAGTGLGASLAHRFGGAGYRVALVARHAASLEERVAELAVAGIEAVAFPADLTDLDGIPALVHSIEDGLGAIDVAVFAPAPSDASFVPAVDLDASTLQCMANIFTFAPVEVSHAVLPGMLARGDGAIVIVGGLTAVVTRPGMSGVGPLMAATRNYVLTLNAEVASRGVYAGTVNIGAVIDRSTGLRAMTASGARLDPNLPVIDPDTIAEEIQTLIASRDRVESILPPLPQS